MKYVIPTFERIEWMPPTITLIQKLAKNGNNVLYITIYPDNYFAGFQCKGSIKNISLCKKEISLQKLFPYVKGLSGMLFRLDNLIKKVICLRLKRTIESELSDEDILWVVNEMTVKLAGTSFLRNRKYLFTIYELHYKNFVTRNIVRAAQNATLVVVPEYCRAHIMQTWYGLSRCPFIIPNKSDLDVDCDISEKIRKAIWQIESIREKNKKVIIYMGGISRERPLEEIIEATHASSKYRLVILGRESAYLRFLRTKYDGCFDYLGNFSPPEHLLVAKHADIGILIYVGLNHVQDLNAIFCAPNKIYEYTGLGLPVIANDIPGLHYEVLFNDIGRLVDYSDEKKLIDQLDDVCDNYEKLSTNAKRYYAKNDIDSIICHAVSKFMEYCIK